MGQKLTNYWVLEILYTSRLRVHWRWTKGEEIIDGVEIYINDIAGGRCFTKGYKWIFQCCSRNCHYTSYIDHCPLCPWQQLGEHN